MKDHKMGYRAKFLTRLVEVGCYYTKSNNYAPMMINYCNIQMHVNFINKIF